MEKTQTTLDVSFVSIIRFFIILALFVLLFFLREILIWVLLALIISILLNPFVDFLELKKISRVLGTGMVYTILLILVILIVGITTPIVIREITDMIPQNLPVIEEALRGIGIDRQEIFKYDFADWDWESIVITATSVIEHLFKGFLALVVIISLSFFFCVEKNKIKDFIGFILPKKKEITSYTFDISQRKVHLWFYVRVISCLFMAFFIYFALLIGGIASPLTLAILIGILSFIPLLGMFVAYILLLTFVAVVHNINLAIIMLVVLIIINQIVDNIITPVISKKVLNISPVLILIAIVIGDHLYGPLGALLAIPIFAIVLEFTKNYVTENRTEKIEEKKKRVIIV